MASAALSPETLRRFIFDEIGCDVKQDEITADFPLIRSGVLDSMGLVRMVAFVETSIGSRLPPEDMVAEHFETIDSIIRLVESRRPNAPDA